MSSPLTDIREWATETLNAHPFFNGDPPIECFTEKIGEIESAINLRVGKMGICCLVMTASGRVVRPNKPGPALDDIRLVIRTFEKVVINRSAAGTNQSADYVATVIARVLHQKVPAGLSSAIYCEDIQLANEPRYFAFDTIFKTQFAFNPTEIPERL